MSVEGRDESKQAIFRGKKKQTKETKGRTSVDRRMK